MDESFLSEEVGLMPEKKATDDTKGKREIKMGDLDPQFKYEMKGVPGFDRLQLCFQCGTCTGDCPIARFSEVYHPRKLIRMAQLGMKKRLLRSEALWLCAACFTCVDHCPQGVDLAGILRALRNMAVKNGIIPAVSKEITENILKTGYAYRIPELRLRKRVERGLPELPKAKVDDIVRLFDVLSVSKLTKKDESEP
jgi:heterodisulfide reductase subunit C